MSIRQPWTKTLGTAPSRRSCEEAQPDPQVVCVEVESQSTNDTNERPQVLRYHPTSTVKDFEVEESSTNGQVDGISHERTSSKVKTSHVGDLNRQSG